jgi:hypothetical protein
MYKDEVMEEEYVEQSIDRYALDYKLWRYTFGSYKEMRKKELSLEWRCVAHYPAPMFILLPAPSTKRTFHATLRKRLTRWSLCASDLTIFFKVNIC